MYIFIICIYICCAVMGGDEDVDDEVFAVVDVVVFRCFGIYFISNLFPVSYDFCWWHCRHWVVLISFLVSSSSPLAEVSSCIRRRYLKYAEKVMNA